MSHSSCFPFSLLQDGTWVMSISVWLEYWISSSTRYPLISPNLCTEELSQLPTQVTISLNLPTPWSSASEDGDCPSSTWGPTLYLEFHGGGGMCGRGQQDNLNWKSLPETVWYVRFAELDVLYRSFSCFFFFSELCVGGHHYCYSSMLNILAHLFPTVLSSRSYLYALFWKW